jgi:lantibiotic modifying enzyme
MNKQSGRMRQDIMNKLHQIESELSAEGPANLSLYSGAMGQAMFYIHLYELTDNEIFLENAQRLIADSIEKLAEADLIHTLAGGFTGIAWTVNYFAKKGYLEDDVDNLFEDVDNYIYQAGRKNLSDGIYDFLHGGLGPVLFALDRLPAQNATSFIEDAVMAIDAIKQEDDNGYKWIDTFSPGDDNIKFNFGLAHGMPGIILMLLKIYSQGQCQAKTADLVRGAIRWMLHYKNGKSEFISLYPSYVYRDKENTPDNLNSRLAWCYGDLSIAWMFWYAGKILNEPLWQQEALAIMDHALKRDEPLHNVNLDAAFCHGAAGLAHLFGKFYRETNDSRYLERSTFWIDKTLALSKFPETLSGYKSFMAPTKQWIPSTGLLEGIAGIGMVLVTHLNHDSAWDECLLLS